MSLLDEARQVLGTRGTTETVNRALAEIVRHEKLRRLTERVFVPLASSAPVRAIAPLGTL